MRNRLSALSNILGGCKK